MMIDKAIAHAREVASEQKRRRGACVQNDSECDKFSTCLKCAEEHEQIAEWLEELKTYRENTNGYNKEDIELNRNAMYNKAIDDCLKIVEWDGYTLDIKHRIEQLKAGEGKNES